MKFKTFFILIMILMSFGAQALTTNPVVIYNKIRSIKAKNCITEDNLLVSDLKNTARVKFVLELNQEGTEGILVMLENEVIVDQYKVTCNKF